MVSPAATTTLTPDARTDSDTDTGTHTPDLNAPDTHAPDLNALDTELRNAINRILANHGLTDTPALRTVPTATGYRTVIDTWVPDTSPNGADLNTPDARTYIIWGRRNGTDVTNAIGTTVIVGRHTYRFCGARLGNRRYPYIFQRTTDNAWYKFTTEQAAAALGDWYVAPPA